MIIFSQCKNKNKNQLNQLESWHFGHVISIFAFAHRFGLKVVSDNFDQPFLFYKYILGNDVY